MEKIFLFIADGFEEVEAITPLDYLRRCGADLTLVGVGAKVIRSSRGLAVTCDITLSELIGEGANAKKNVELCRCRIENTPALHKDDFLPTVTAYRRCSQPVYVFCAEALYEIFRSES